MGYLETVIIKDDPGNVPNKMHVDFKQKRVEATLTVYAFEDHGFIMNYVPALNLSSYGDTQEEALEMMLETILPDFYDNLVEYSPAIAFQHLSKFGWSASAIESFVNSAYVDKNGVLRNFNLPQDTLIEEVLITV